MKRTAARVALPSAAFALVFALLAGCAPAVEEPTPEPRKSLALTIGALLPESGSLADFGPATRAALQLAVDDVNVAGLPIELAVEYRDSGDSASETGVASTADLLGLGVDAIVGPLSNGVSKQVIASVVAAGIPMISPGNTDPDFTGYADDDLYWRTAPSCMLVGDALAAQVAASGADTAGVLIQTERCGEGLNRAIDAGLVRRGLDILVEASLDDGGTVEGAVAAFTEAAPDAVVLVTSQGKAAIAPLAAAGFAGDQLFFLGLPPGDYSADFALGALEGATAVSPGVDVGALGDFTDRLLELDPAISTFRYAAETYDAVVLLALAALAANGTAGDQIAGSLQEVSGGSGDGEPCTDVEDCAAIILDGGIADYEGLSGSITFDVNGDPTEAVIGVFRGGEDNVFERLDP